MQNEKEENLHSQPHSQSHDRPCDRGEMKKRRVIMEDGRRYLIFYTFEKPAFPISGEKQHLEAGAEEQENV